MRGSLRVYTSPGTCSGGACTYASTPRTCDYGCADGACNPATGCSQVVAPYNVSFASLGAFADICWDVSTSHASSVWVPAAEGAYWDGNGNRVTDYEVVLSRTGISTVNLQRFAYWVEVRLCDGFLDFSPPSRLAFQYREAGNEAWESTDLFNDGLSSHYNGCVTSSIQGWVIADPPTGVNDLEVRIVSLGGDSLGVDSFLVYEFGIGECFSDARCDDSDPSTVDTCVDNLCVNQN